MPETMVDVLTDPESWLIVVVTVVIVTMCVALHYEVLTGCGKFLASLHHRHRGHTMSLILIIMLTHVLEMWFFAFGYFFLDDLAGQTGLTGVPVVGLRDYAYYSAMVYTTVGFGDIVPSGDLRFMTGMEALTGLVMITWSASFTFLVMQRYWKT